MIKQQQIFAVHFRVYEGKKTRNDNILIDELFIRQRITILIIMFRNE